jgi:hypothetical protein
VQPLTHRHSMQMGASVSLTHWVVQNAAPHATVSPVQAMHSVESPVASCVHIATQDASASIVAGPQLGKQDITSNASGPQPGSTGSEVVVPKTQSPPMAEAASEPAYMTPSWSVYVRSA